MVTQQQRNAAFITVMVEAHVAKNVKLMVEAEQESKIAVFNIFEVTHIMPVNTISVSVFFIWSGENV